MAWMSLRIADFPWRKYWRCEVHFYLFPEFGWPVEVWTKWLILEINLPCVFTLEFSLYHANIEDLLDDI